MRLVNSLSVGNVKLRFSASWTQDLDETRSDTSRQEMEQASCTGSFAKNYKRKTVHGSSGGTARIASTFSVYLLRLGSRKSSFAICTARFMQCIAAIRRTNAIGSVPEYRRRDRLSLSLSLSLSPQSRVSRFGNISASYDTDGAENTETIRIILRDRLLYVRKIYKPPNKIYDSFIHSLASRAM